MNSTDIIRFVRDFRIVKKDDKTWINLVHDREAVEKMKTVTGLTLLDALYLSDTEVSDLFHKFTLLQRRTTKKDAREKKTLSCASSFSVIRST